MPSSHQSSGTGGRKSTVDEWIQQKIEDSTTWLESAFSGASASKSPPESGAEQASKESTQGGRSKAIDNAKKAEQLRDQIISLRTLDKRTSAGRLMKDTIAKTIAELEDQLKRLEESPKDK